MKNSLLLKLLTAALLIVAEVDGRGSILGRKELKIDFTDPSDATNKATWSDPNTLTLGKGGLGWDGEAAQSRDGWIHTKSLALGLSWRPPMAVTVRVTIQPLPTEIELPNGQKMTPYGGDVYVRYSPDLKHWSLWQALQRSGQEPSESSRSFSAAVRVPRRERAAYDKLLSEYSSQDVPWKSDEEAAVNWIVKRNPDFFAGQIPFIGYVEFLYEGSFHGSQCIRSLDAVVHYGMSGVHSVPKDQVVYEGRHNIPWRFVLEQNLSARIPDYSSMDMESKFNTRGDLEGISSFHDKHPDLFRPRGGLIPDAETAIKIAIAVWEPVYGKEKIAGEKPYRAVLTNGVWIVEGSLPEGSIGGVARADIVKEDGRILGVSHGQ